MMFTVVTIVFAPLSFMTSVFGMNAMEFSSENSWKILDELKYICKTSSIPPPPFSLRLTITWEVANGPLSPVPVSAATILLVLFLAFNPFVRALVKAAYYRVNAQLLTRQAWGYSVYKVWYSNNSWRGEEQIDKAHAYAHKKKKAARDEVLNERREKSSQKEEEEQQQKQNNNGGSDYQVGGNAASIPQDNSGQQPADVSIAVTNNGGTVSPAAAGNGAYHNEDAGKEVQVAESQASMQPETLWRWLRRAKKEEPRPSV